jgi:hypothetical protein
MAEGIDKIKQSFPMFNKIIEPLKTHFNLSFGYIGASARVCVPILS